MFHVPRVHAQLCFILRSEVATDKTAIDSYLIVDNNYQKPTTTSPSMLTPIFCRLKLTRFELIASAWTT